MAEGLRASDGGGDIWPSFGDQLLAQIKTPHLYRFAATNAPTLVLYADDGSVYLERWAMKRDKSGVMYVHRFSGPDPDRPLHDHPYDFVSIILAGGYTETVQNAEGGLDTVKRCAGDVILRRAETPHRITEIAAPGQTWSLVLSGPRVRTFGFHTDDGWMPWEPYEAARKATLAAAASEQADG